MVLTIGKSVHTLFIASDYHEHKCWDTGTLNSTGN